MLPSHTVPPAFLCPSAPAKPSRTRALLHCQLSPNTLPPCPPPPADYDNRILTHDRAMRAGLDDVGLGALFGLYDYKYEVGGCWGSAGQQQQHGRHSWLWHIHAHVIHLSACAITITTGAMTPIPLLREYGAGPHTLSVPRMRPADGSDASALHHRLLQQGTRIASSACLLACSPAPTTLL